MAHLLGPGDQPTHDPALARARASRGGGGSANRATTPDAAEHAVISQWQTELDELRAGAFRADNLARHAYLHELKTLLISIEVRQRDWQREIKMLYASPQKFWENAFNGDLQLTWQHLTRLSDANGDIWPGFGANVDQTLQRATGRR